MSGNTAFAILMIDAFQTGSAVAPLEFCHPPVEVMVSHVRSMTPTHGSRPANAEPASILVPSAIS